MALHATDSDVPLLQDALRDETVKWVRTALTRAIERASTFGPSIPRLSGSDPEPSSAVLRDLKAEALEEVAGTIVHEFAPLVGLLRVQARAEIADYEASETRKLLDMLSAVMRGVRELKAAAAVPTYEDLDLAQLVAEALGSLPPAQQGLVALAGPRPFLAVADRTRLLLALGNGLRNAVEAAEENANAQPPSVIVNWGNAGEETWFAIIDSGRGFSGNPSSALKMGATTKAGHIGFGLATAQQSLRSMEGDIYLSNGTDGGARFEARWFRNDANPIR